MRKTDEFLGLILFSLHQLVHIDDKLEKLDKYSTLD